MNNIYIFFYLFILSCSVSRAQSSLPPIDSENLGSPLCSISQDWEQTLKHAREGHILAVRMMAIYFDSCHSDKDERLAWLKVAAKIGDARDLGIFADKLLKKNLIEESEKYYRESAARGSHAAEIELAEACIAKKFSCRQGEELELLERAVRGDYYRVTEKLADRLIISNVPLGDEKALGWLLYAHRKNNCFSSKTSREKIQALKSKMTDVQFEDALSFSHPTGGGEVDGVPIDGRPCPEETK